MAHAEPVAAPRGNSGKATARVPELDGLRGLAILLVILCHYISNSDGGSSRAISYFVRLFSLGWSGVDLFFVLSGFLIGGILLDAKESPRYFRAFYYRRVHRIIPIYYLWVTLYAAGLFFAARWGEAGVMPVPLYYLFLQNLVFVEHAGLAWYWISVTWSLAVEEQFYLAAPPLVRWLSRRTLMVVLISCVVMAPLLRWWLATHYGSGYLAAYVLMPCRADALALGILTAMAWRSPRGRSWLVANASRLRLVWVLLLVGTGALLKWFPDPYSLFTQSVGFTWLALFYTVLMLLALLRSNGLIARCSRWAWLRELGTVSYCVYLIHFLVLAGCHWLLLGGRPRFYDLPGLGVTLLAAALTYGLAKLSWVFFEKPLIRRGQSYSYWPEPAVVGVMPLEERTRA